VLVLKRAKTHSPYSCDSCGGATVWILPVSPRNIAVIIARILLVLMLAVVMVHVTKTAVGDLVILTCGASGLALSRRLFKEQLVCNACVSLRSRKI